MITTQRRIALLTGASLAALGVSVLTATPALAAAPHDTLADGTYPGTQATADSVVICDLVIPGNPTVPGAPCFFGVIDTSGAVATATVDTFTNGEIGVHHGPGAGYMSNGGTAEFGAIASATNAAGDATADAHLNAILYENPALGSAVAGDVYYTAVNNGVLLFDAIANAYASGPVGNAHADATITNALHQAAFSTNNGDVKLDVTNAGTLSVIASANATAGYNTGTAGASATISTAVIQHGTGGNVVLNMYNTDTISIGAVAHANAASTADANAAVTIGIEQLATATAGAAANFRNEGHVTEFASAVAAGSGGSANAAVNSANYQIVNGAYATAFFSNAGVIDVGAYASMQATSTGTANAFAEYIIEQDVVATTGAAYATVSNTGTMNLHATAIAGGGSDESAVATANEAIVQDVTGYTTAIASLVNGGAINVTALARATGTTYDADASAILSHPITQDVTATGAGGVASANIYNSGTINMNASAYATATKPSQTVHAYAGMGTTEGVAQFAIQQNVGAYSTANANFTNTGSVNLNALAHADGHEVTATAVMAGLRQSGFDSPVINENFLNTGTFQVGANAFAHGSSAVANATAVGIVQTAGFASTIAQYQPTAAPSTSPRLHSPTGCTRRTRTRTPATGCSKRHSSRIT